MKAAVYTKRRSGKVLEIRDFEQPVAKDNEIVVRVRAASVNPLDWLFGRDSQMRGRSAKNAT
jgi:NADPH:quinone reductase-like Zn-dependent oxidoreductase